MLRASDNNNTYRSNISLEKFMFTYLYYYIAWVDVNLCVSVLSVLYISS